MSSQNHCPTACSRFLKELTSSESFHSAHHHALHFASIAKQYRRRSAHSERSVAAIYIVNERPTEIQRLERLEFERREMETCRRSAV
jgi:hypothetical protein